MNIKKSNTYTRDILKLKVDLSLIIVKILELLEDNPSHPSLHKKNIQCRRANNLYSISINKQYRILYFKYEDYLELYRILNHDKYDRLVKDC